MNSICKLDFTVDIYYIVVCHSEWVVPALSNTIMAQAQEKVTAITDRCSSDATVTAAPKWFYREAASTVSPSALL